MAEAQTLARFKHPNIVQVQTVFEQHGTAYMAMEYENGESLATLLRQKKLRVDQSFIESLLFPVMEGLQLVHNADYLHRDIKPSNIYLREDLAPVLIDFGSSRQAGVLNNSDATVFVTKGYTPLEQYSRGYGEQGPWTDIYAIAASVYYAVSGNVPADAIERDAFSRSGKEDSHHSFASQAGLGYSSRFTNAIDSALAILPQDRPQTLIEWRSMFEDEDDRTVLYKTDPSTKTSSGSIEDQNSPPASNVISEPSLTDHGLADSTEYSADSVIANSVDSAVNEIDEEWATPQSSRSEHESNKNRTPGLGKLVTIASVLSVIVVAASWLLYTKKTSVDSDSYNADDISSYTALPQPAVPLEIFSPIDRINREIEAISRALELYNQVIAMGQESSEIRLAVESIAKRFYTLASSPIVITDKKLRDKIAAGIVASAGVTAENRDLLAGLVRKNSVSPEAKLANLQNLLDAASIETEQRETLVYELARLSSEQKQTLDRDKQISMLEGTFVNAITQQIKNEEFDKAARMTEIALLINPSNKNLKALATHLSDGQK